MVETQYHKWYSPSLGQDMELKVYGTSGRPMIVFPSSEGRFFQYEDSGMVECIKYWLETQKIKLYAVDSVDSQSFFAKGKWPGDMTYRHMQYEDYIMKEVVPFVYSQGHYGRIMATGVSWGAFHTVNFVLKYPKVFDIGIALSGVYDLRELPGMGDYYDDNFYYQNPVAYMANAHGQALDEVRNTFLILAAGQGRWEEQTLRTTQRLADTLREKGVPVWQDHWGHDVDHDWPSWRAQMPYFLSKLNL
eukprot:GEZU01029753.1.p1 GENE.GEZU01029753.1~~GEZU01029753.1.p1  ORF type:complete len:278 (-),score=60.98 GEZU01029753.1:23-763(-)